MVTYKSQYILINKLNGILSDKEFFKAIEGKNSWKVITLKDKLTEWAQDQKLEVESELEDIFTLPFFRYKKYLAMRVVPSILGNNKVGKIYSTQFPNIIIRLCKYLPSIYEGSQAVRRSFNCEHGFKSHPSCR